MDVVDGAAGGEKVEVGAQQIEEAVCCSPGGGGGTCGLLPPFSVGRRARGEVGKEREINRNATAVPEWTRSLVSIRPNHDLLLSPEPASEGWGRCRREEVLDGLDQVDAQGRAGQGRYDGMDFWLPVSTGRNLPDAATNAQATSCHPCQPFTLICTHNNPGADHCLRE